MNLTIRRCTESDLHTLREIGIETYDDTFRSMNTVDTMQKYLEEAFDAEKLLAELKTSGSAFYTIFEDDVLMGYVKINEFDAQTDIKDPAALEIERIYVKKEFKGKRIGTKLMEFAIEQARQKGKTYVWLGVWEKNTSALEFYKKHGFSEVGKHFFKMGDELQTDFVMKRGV